MAGIQQLPVDSQVRDTALIPLFQWYNGNDGPWIPRGISVVVPDQRTNPRNISNRAPIPMDGRERHPNPSDHGHFQFGAPHSDSGYGTQRSIGNTSIYSGDIPERDQDCPSLGEQSGDLQQFQGINEALQARERGFNEAWPVAASISASSPGLFSCPTCRKSVKNQSELKYGARGLF